ncbi:MAG TPA: translation initiation factor IF-2 [Clostridiaceae bacterium]|nr:translation initiation factor IF-2 [Clostridiaceae bacterium]
MTKNVSSEPNAEEVKDQAPQKPEAQSEVAASSAQADEPKQEQADDVSVVKMKGVSGKTITGTVRVVKAGRKDASDKGHKDETSKPEPAQSADNAADVSTASSDQAKNEAATSTQKTETTKKSDSSKSKTSQAAETSKSKTLPPKKPGVPGKVGNIFDQRRKAQEKKKAEQANAKSQGAGKGDSAEQKQRSTSRGKKQASPKTTARKAPPRPTRQDDDRPHTHPAVPLTVDRPKVKRPGKVGNIFDNSDKDAAKSSLAATAEMHAQRMAEKKRRNEKRQTQRREQRDQRFQSKPASRVSGPEPFPDKDKDEEQPKFQSRPRKRRRTTPQMDMFATGRGSGGRNFGRRKNNDNRRDYDDGSTRRRQRTRRDNRPEDVLDPRYRRTKNRQREERKAQTPRAVLTHVSLPEQITVKEFAEAIKKTTAEVIKELMKNGIMATINQVIDYDTASIIAGEFDIETDKLIEVTEEDILFDESEDDAADLVPRPPVVVVMGHVDHGKTSLLDYYRKSSVVSDEAGGITQHIGAYMVNINDRQITFLDTPGHEAFTTMRARGALVTDIAILVVAADDGVMPQTIEAINHAKAAKTQIIVAINKIDKADTNIERIKQQLTQYELVPEEWGGDTIMVPVSAKTGAGMDELLEMVLLTADVLELKANPDRQAKGTIIEAKLDKHRGAVATLLVQRGTLHAGETIVTGSIVGNIRAMTDATGAQRKTAGPSVPVEIIGLSEVPEAGELFYAVSDERMARQLAEKRRVKQREDEMKKSSRMSLDTLFNKMSEGEVKDLNLIVKADVQGSVEAVTQSLERLTNDEVNVRVIHGAVGAVTESDLRLAEVSDAIVIGFNVRPATNVDELAKEAGIDIRLYRVIYNAIEDIEAAMKGLLEPEYEEVAIGTIELREVFKISSVGTVGGGYVMSGKLTRSAHVRVVRDGIVVAEDEVASLRRFKDDVREVSQGYECGVTLSRFHDLKVGDIIEAFEMREIERD